MTARVEVTANRKQCRMDTVLPTKRPDSHSIGQSGERGSCIRRKPPQRLAHTNAELQRGAFRHVPDQARGALREGGDIVSLGFAGFVGLAWHRRQVERPAHARNKVPIGDKQSSHGRLMAIQISSMVPDQKADCSTTSPPQTTGWATQPAPAA